MKNPAHKVFSLTPSTIEVKGKKSEKSPDCIADNFSNALSLDAFYRSLPPDLPGWSELYLKIQVEGIRTPETLRAVRNDLRKFNEFFREYHNGTDIRLWLPRTTQRFIEYLEQKGQKPKTVKRALVSVGSCARWVLSVRSDLFQLGDPTLGIKPPIQEALRPQGLTDRQVKQVLDAAYHLICQSYPDQRIGEIDRTHEAWYRKAHRQMRRPFRDYAIIMLLLNTGLRRNEVCDLRLEQLQDKHLRNVKCKGNQYRDLLLPKETQLALQVYLNEERPRDANYFPRSGALFLPSSSRKHRNQTGKLSARSINAIIDHVTREANKNLSAADRIDLHPHNFRHTHAYKLLEEGRSLTYIQKRLGHQSMTYLVLYTQMPENKETELLDKAEFK